MKVFFLILCGSPLLAINSHPRIWLSPTVLSELRVKACIGQGGGCVVDPDYTAIKTDADTLKTYPPQKLTVTSISNANPAVVTVSEDIGVNGWFGGIGSQVSMYMGGLPAGPWAALNTPNTRVSLGNATKTGTHTFTVPFDSTTWGAYPGGAILFYNNATANNMLYYDYEGLGWLSWFEELGLMYQLTGDSSYATNALALLDYINTLAPVSLVAPFAIDSGFPARGAAVGLALALDWFYPLLSGGQIAATVTTLNTWYAFYQTNISNTNIIFIGQGDAVSNYWGGFMLGFGLAGLATDSETGNNAAAITAFVRSQMDTYVAQATTSPVAGWLPDASDLCPSAGGSATCGGTYTGGYEAEGYNYGPNHIQRLLGYFFAVNTATNEDMFSTTTYAPALTLAIARNITYSLFPNMWQAPNVGESAEVLPMYLNLPVMISYLRSGHTESGWMQYLVGNLATPPGGLPSYVGFQGALSSSIPMDHFLWYRSSITPVNYTLANPAYYISPGQDGEVHWRSDWTTNATKLTFTAGAGFLAGHHIRNAGGLTLTRGSDYLIINAGHYAGTNGYSGSSPDTIISDDSPVLHFDDNGDYMFGYQTQQNWGPYSLPLAKVASAYAYGQNDITYAYDDSPGHFPESDRTLRYYFRSVGQLGNCTIVYDRMLSLLAGYAKTLYWPISPITTAVPTLAANTASAVVGSSKVFVSPILPASPTTALTQISGGSPYRMEISDSAGLATATFVTLIYSTSSGGSEPTSSNLTATNAVAVQVVDSTPVVFANANVVTSLSSNTYAATPQTSISLTSTHSGTGNYLVGGLAAGTYSVTLGGSPILTGQTVGADGSLYFSSTAGAIVVSQGSPPPPPTTGTAFVGGFLGGGIR